MMDRTLLVLSMLLMASCDQESTAPSPSTNVPGREGLDRLLEAPEVATAPIQVASAISDTDLKRVCRATVAALNGRQPSIMEVDRVVDGIVYISYSRPSDGKVWKNRCKIENGRVIWGTVDAFGEGSGEGRWRTHADDEVISYRIDGQTITITQTFSDGSSSEDSYTVSG